MIYLFLLSLWPILSYVSENFQKLRFTGYRGLFFILLGIFFILSISEKIFSKFSKDFGSKSLPFFLTGVLLFFSYGSVVNIFNNPYIKATLPWAIFSSVLLLASWFLSRKEQSTLVAKAIICGLLILPSFSIVKDIYSGKNPFKNSEKNLGGEEFFLLKNKPNIYYILLDAYGRQDSLKKITGYNNEPFLKKLQKRGFLVSRESYSNYHFTIASLSATMNMEYHQPFQNNPSIFDYGSMRESLKGNNRVRRILKANGYKIINIPAHWTEMQGSGYEDVLIQNSGLDICVSFFSSTLLSILSIRNHYVSFSEAWEASFLFPKTSKFIFAHFAQVHDAVYNKDGEFTSVLKPSLSDYKEDCLRYIFSIQTMNKKLLSFVDKVRKKDPSAIIIIQSDHGPTYTGGTRISEHDSSTFRVNSVKEFGFAFGNLSAVYLPNYKSPIKEKVRSYLSGKSTLINTFRCIFSYLSGQKGLQLLEDRCYFLVFDKSLSAYKEVDITKTTKEIGL